MKARTVFVAGLVMLVMTIAGFRIFGNHPGNPKVAACWLIWTQRVEDPHVNLDTPEMRQVIASIHAQMPNIETVSKWTAKDAENLRWAYPTVTKATP